MRGLSKNLRRGKVSSEAPESRNVGQDGLGIFFRGKALADGKGKPGRGFLVSSEAAEGLSEEKMYFGFCVVLRVRARKELFGHQRILPVGKQFSRFQECHGVKILNGSRLRVDVCSAAYYLSPKGSYPKGVSMDGLLKVIEERRSFRGIDERGIPEDVLERVMTAATLAPSCFNKQPWRFLVLKDGAALDRGRSHLKDGNYWAKKAPVLIVVITKTELDCQVQNREYAEFDTGQAVMSLGIQAWHEGLIAHPMAGFDDETIAEEFGIADGYRVITVVALAYPGDESFLSEKHLEMEHSERSRKPLEKVVFFDSWAPGD
jgi:nitroreductase